MRAARTLLALLLLLAPRAIAAPLKIATWNLDWLTLRSHAQADLPDDAPSRVPADFARLAWYASVLGADVVAVEEVDGPETLARVFPPAAYSFHFTEDRVVQRVGFAIRRGIAFTANPDLTALNVYADGAPFPLRSGADVTLHLPGGDLRLLAVHLKTGCWSRPLSDRARACAVLRAQLPVVADWIAARRRDGTAFAVLGDFNRDFAPGDGFLSGLAPAGALRNTDAGEASPCWGGEDFIDHILLGGAAMGWMLPGSLHVLAYRETSEAAKPHLSDHCPVSIALDPVGKIGQAARP